MTVWPSMIFALMCFGMTHSCCIFPPFYLAFSRQLAPHINREQITQCLDRNISYLSFPIFFLDVSFFCRISKFFSATFVQIKKCICPSCKQYLSKVKMDIDKSFIFSPYQVICLQKCVCPNCKLYLSKLTNLFGH